MPLPLELLDKYQTTLLDFWRLRPRRFLAELKKTPAKYLTPGVFAGISATILLTSEVVSSRIMALGYEKLGYGQFPPAEAVAVQILVLLLVALFVLAIFFRTISPLWPVSGRKVSIVEVWNFQCYMFAIYVAFGVSDVIITPLYCIALRNGPTRLATMVIYYIALGAPLFFFFQVSGIAALNHTSSTRVFLAVLLWLAAFGTVVALVVVARRLV